MLPIFAGFISLSLLLSISFVLF